MTMHAARPFFTDPLPGRAAAYSSFSTSSVIDSGFRDRRKALDNVALAVDQELREIPLDRLDAEHARLLLRQDTYRADAFAPLTSIFSNIGNVTP